MSEVTTGSETMLKPLERKNYWALDIVKFICALTIISAHFASEWGSFPSVVDYAFSIYIIAVPFFFACSGFLFFVKLNTIPTREGKFSYLWNYEKRILIMYGLWSAVYMIHVVASWAANESFGIKNVLNWLHMAIVLQTYSTIWFLPALAVGVAIAYFLVTRLSKGQMIALCAVLYVFGMFGQTYSFVFAGTPVGTFYEWYLIVFKTTRNGVFNALPFIYMGYLASGAKIEPNKSNALKYGACAAVSFGLMIGESFILKMKFNVTGMDFGIFVAVFTYFLLMTALCIDLKERKIFVWLRKLSILIFVSQRLFLSLLPYFLPELFATLYKNSYFGLILVIALTIGFSVGFIFLSKKVKFLKRMY